jgi:AcrR family transcriptional regulator
MLAAAAEAVAEKGIAHTTVGDVITRAGVSRETFYEQFSDKEDCFLAAMDAGVQGLLEILAAAIARPARDAVDRFGNVLDAYFDALVAEPVFSKAYLVESYGAGARAVQRRAELQQRFAEAVAGIFGVGSDAPDSFDRFACEALVAAVSSLVTARVAAGRIAELPELRTPLLELVRRQGIGASSKRTRGARA